MSSNKSSDTLFHDSQSFIQTDKNFWRACSRCKKMSIKVSLETSCDLLPKHFHIFFCYCIRFIGANRNCLEFLELAQFTPIFSWVHLHITLCFRIFVDFYPSFSLNLTLVYFSLTHVVLNDSRINFPSIYPQFSWIQFKFIMIEIISSTIPCKFPIFFPRTVRMGSVIAANASSISWMKTSSGSMKISTFSSSGFASLA